METKYVRVPFDVELSKEISNGSKEGRVVTRNGRNVRIICWDAHMDGNVIALIEYDEGVESICSCVSDGKLFLNKEHPLDLLLEIPEYMTFKEGDVIAFGNNEDNLVIGIFKNQINKRSHSCYVKYDCYGYLVYDVEPLTYCNARFATEEEKQKLIKALKASKDHEAKEYLKRFFGIEKKNEYNFKPFDKVLVRDDENEKW